MCENCKKKKRSSIIGAPASTPSPANLTTTPSVSSISSTIKDIETSLEHVHGSISTISDSIKLLEDGLKELETLKEENVRISNTLRTLEKRISQLETARKNSPLSAQNDQNDPKTFKLTLSGLKIDESHDLHTIFTELLSLLELPNDLKDDITTLRRLKPRGNSAAAVICVELKSQDVLAKILKSFRRKDITNSELGLEGDQKIFLNEMLSKTRYTLFKAAKDLKNHGFRFVWIQNGNILARKVEGERVTVIKSQAVIDSLKSS